MLNINEKEIFTETISHLEEENRQLELRIKHIMRKYICYNVADCQKERHDKRCIYADNWDEEMCSLSKPKE